MEEILSTSASVDMEIPAVINPPWLYQVQSARSSDSTLNTGNSKFIEHWDGSHTLVENDTSPKSVRFNVEASGPEDEDDENTPQPDNENETENESDQNNAENTNKKLSNLPVKIYKKIIRKIKSLFIWRRGHGRRVAADEETRSEEQQQDQDQPEAAPENEEIPSSPEVSWDADLIAGYKTRWPRRSSHNYSSGLDTITTNNGRSSTTITNESVYNSLPENVVRFAQVQVHNVTYGNADTILRFFCGRAMLSGTTSPSPSIWNDVEVLPEGGGCCSSSDPALQTLIAVSPSSSTPGESHRSVAPTTEYSDRDILGIDHGPGRGSHPGVEQSPEDDEQENDPCDNPHEASANMDTDDLKEKQRDVWWR